MDRISITINGKPIVASGSNVSIEGGKVFIDGKAVDVDTSEAKEVHVTIEGGVTGNLMLDCGSVTVNGNVGGNACSSIGDVHVTGKVEGNAHTSQGSINCGNVGGNAESKLNFWVSLLGFGFGLLISEWMKQSP